MRITFILPTVNMSGGIRVVAIYAKALSERGHTVTLVSPPPIRITLRFKIKSILTGKPWVSNRESHVDGLGLEHLVLDRWRPIIDADVPDADVVIATWWETAEWVSELSARKGVKVYFIQHHEVHEHLPVERCRATYYMPLHKIVIAKWLKNVMRDKYGDEDVDLVPNSVDHAHFFFNFRGKQTIPTVGFLFSSSKFKGVDVTLKAISKLRETFPNLRVISFGSVKPSRDVKFDSQIEFYYSPAQDRIRDLYSQCDAWLTASRTEGFNLPAMEAMACGTPVVSTKAGWPEEAVLTGINGVLVDVDDVEAFKQGVASVLTLTDDAWREMSRYAHETVATSSWRDSADQFEMALERVCQGSDTTL